MNDEQIEHFHKEAEAVLGDFTNMGLPEGFAKKAAIRSLRMVIKELQLQDDIHLVGFKPRIDGYRVMILYLVEK